MGTAIYEARRRDQLVGLLDAVRDRTLGILEPLNDDDVHRQYNSIMGPIAWDVGHIGNYEEYWLLRQLDGRPAHDPRLDTVYNPFDNPRWTRANLDILDRTDALKYLAEVRGEAYDLMGRIGPDPDLPLTTDGFVWNLAAQHEAQHQETIYQALNLRDDLSPYLPATEPVLPKARPVDDEARVVIPGGTFDMGTNDGSAAYDNERPRHRVDVATFTIDRFPVTVRRYAAFVAAGGYRKREHWSDEGWSWLQEVGHEHPQGWIPDLDGGWLIRRFGHVRPLNPAEPVQHVSFHEAAAFAREAGGRLPTEAEWEKAASWDPERKRSRVYPWGDSPPTSEHANLLHRGWGPAPVGAYPKGASAYGVEQLLGDTYEWTTSRFAGYPGYVTFPYKEYSEVFFGGDYRVLRGASWATSRHVARNTFRNWDYPIRRQIFAGIRLARDVA